MGDEQPGPEAFIDALCGSFSAMARAREVQVQQNGEVIPFLFMAEVGRHIEGLHAAGVHEASPVRDELVRLLTFLEGAHAGGNEEVRQLVEAAFTDSLEAASPTYEDLRPFIGPALRRAVEAGWKP